MRCAMHESANPQRRCAFAGHWSDRWGISYHNGWLNGHDRYGGDDNRYKWILTCSRPQAAWHKISGLDRKQITGGNTGAPSRLHIAWGRHGDEHSDWEFAEISIFNRKLSEAEAEENFQFYMARFGIE